MDISATKSRGVTSEPRPRGSRECSGFLVSSSLGKCVPAVCGKELRSLRSENRRRLGAQAMSCEFAAATTQLRGPIANTPAITSQRVASVRVPGI